MVARDRITLRGITATGHHGVLAWEKEAGQPFVVDLELGLDLRPAGLRDDLTETVNYAELARLVSDDVATGALDLIEALAERIARLVLGWDGRIDEIRVTVHKPRAPIPAEHGVVSVSVLRTRADLDDDGPRSAADSARRAVGADEDVVGSGTSDGAGPRPHGAVGQGRGGADHD